jgi:hypothetical protein
MLPKISYTIFECELPLSKKTIKFRPLLVKEEKILLTAKEAGDYKSIISSVEQILNNCIITDVDIRSLPIVDIEYFFIQLYSKSVNSVISATVKDPIDNKIYNTEIKIDSAQLIMPTFDPNIKLTDDIGIIMKYPTFKICYDIQKFDKEQIIPDIGILASCIESVYDGDNIYPIADYSLEEIVEFIEGLTAEAANRIGQFFRNLPVLSIKYEYKRNDGSLAVWEVRSLADFFTGA